MMADFGHKSYIGGGMCIDAWGASPFVISAGGKSFRFEDSDGFGRPSRYSTSDASS